MLTKPPVPSRGLLRDCTTSPINRFAALVWIMCRVFAVSCSEPFVLQGDGDELLDGEDTMKDLRTTFAGIFGEKK